MKFTIGSTNVPIKVWASLMELEAEEQVKRLSELPFLYSHIAVMPDVHAGRGSTVGTVIATRGAIIPACVGVDIGCGMSAVKLPFGIDKFERLSELRHSIERAVPVGREGNRTLSTSVKDYFLKMELPRAQRYANDKALNRAREQLGSLGGGNHFIEVCQDQHGGAWIMLHSGSRNIGKELADIHINGAKELMKRYFISLPDPDLAYLAQNTLEFGAYIHDLHWAQGYAKANRAEMMKRVLEQVKRHVKLDVTPVLEIDCHHNYTTQENHYGHNVWITRKGAVSAREGELGIIPGSMGTGSFIVEGLGNAESFNSCSHGAGRKMSRTKARATFSQEDLAKQTEGVECRKDKDVVDEIPGAYKDINDVMADQVDLVRPLYSLKQILCIKG